MSLQVQGTIYCDGEGCAAYVMGPIIRRFTAEYAGADARAEALAKGWLVTDHGRFYQQRHFCPGCADKPMPKLKPLKRKVTP